MKRLVVRLVPFLWFNLGLIRLWALVPRELRRKLGRKLLTGTVPERTRLDQPRAPLIVLGLLRGTTAFGWAARGNLQLAAEAGVEAHALDLSEMLARDNLLLEAPPPAPRHVLHGPGTLVLHINPNAFPYVRGFLPDAVFDQKYVIASCAWELERIPEGWVRHLELADELWVPSQFVADAFRNAGVRVPCRIVPPLFGAPAELDSQADRFRSSQDEFVVLTAFSFGSGTSRKNPYAALAAFRAAFADTDRARLIMKVSDTGSMPESWAKFREECSGGSRITLISERLNDRAMWGLIDSCDVVLSLHRAEGFGMLPAQGMLLGKAVIATGWSGNLDFMTPDNSALVPYKLVLVDDPEGVFEDRSLCWAEPEVTAAAASLRHLYQNVSSREALGRKAQQEIQIYLSEQREALVRYLREIGSRR